MRGVRLSLERGPATHPQAAFAVGLLVLLLVLAGGLVAMTAPYARSHVDVTLSAHPGQVASGKIVDAGRVLLLEGGHHAEAAARMHFTLPAADPSAARWVVWLDRQPLDVLQLRRDDWAPQPLSFYRPAPGEGVLPAAYIVPMPAHWTGEVTLDLRVSGEVRDALRPRVLREDEALHLEQRGVILATATYASMFVLALLALALFTAARDWLFLSYFGYATLGLFMLLAVNGHLFALPWLRVFADWGAQGLWAFAMLFAAASLQLLAHFVRLRNHAPRAVRVVDVLSGTMLAVTLICLVDLRVFDAWVHGVGTTLWVLAAVVTLSMLGEAAWRRVPMAAALVVGNVLTIAAALLYELSTHGNVMDIALARYGYQLGIVLTALLLAVALVRRISEYRDQRDRDRLARADSERRMQREAARSALANALQLGLRNVEGDRIHVTAFELLLDHLSPLVPGRLAAVVGQRQAGEDVLLARPADDLAGLRADVARRLLALRRLAANGIPMQQPMGQPGSPSDVAMEALLPLPIRAPAWGLLVLRRDGSDGFSNQELSLAGEFVRLTMTHIEQAVAAIKLRRSAELDALTGSFNRRTVDQWLARSFGEAARDRQPISVLFVDLDHFKSVNDRYGHACGDECLRKVSAALQAPLGEEDLFGRYGGEEFIAILPGRGGAAARVLGEQLRAAVENLEVDWEGQRLPLSVSVGVATRIEGETDPEATLARADKALYAAKRNGRNCVHVAPAVFS